MGVGSSLSQEANIHLGGNDENFSGLSSGSQPCNLFFAFACLGITRLCYPSDEEQFLPLFQQFPRDLQL